VVLPGEQTVSVENVRLVRLNKSALSVYELEAESEEDRERPIDRFFWPCDLEHLRSLSLVLQLDHKGLTAVHEQRNQNHHEPGLKHILTVRKKERERERERERKKERKNRQDEM